MELEKFFKHDSKAITETFRFKGLRNFKIEGSDEETPYVSLSGTTNGKISARFDERDKQAFIDLLRSMADSLDETSIADLRDTEQCKCDDDGTTVLEISCGTKEAFKALANTQAHYAVLRDSNWKFNKK